MKIAIIAANNIRVSPYVLFYLNICAENQWETHVFVPDRLEIQETISYGELHTFKSWDESKKFSSYRKYAKWVKAQVRDRKIDFIITLTALSSVFCSPLLLSKHFKGKYIIDIRDYSYEHISLFKLIEKRLVRNAALRVISSRKYECFLPKNENYLVCHNISFDVTSQAVTEFKTETNLPIKIGYIGAVSYEDQCYKLIDLVKNDSRFAFEIYGKGVSSELVEDYVEKIHCSRIQCHGAYQPNEKASIIKGVDILFNAYGNDSMKLTCALSNKLYDAFFYGKPLLNSPNTYMDEMGSIISFPIYLDKEKNLESLFEWYIHIDNAAATQYAKEMMFQFVQENADTINMIECTINKDNVQRKLCL